MSPLTLFDWELPVSEGIDDMQLAVKEGLHLEVWTALPGDGI
jgi:hypothetical protein